MVWRGIRASSLAFPQRAGYNRQMGTLQWFFRFCANLVLNLILLVLLLAEAGLLARGAGWALQRQGPVALSPGTALLALVCLMAALLVLQLLGGAQKRAMQNWVPWFYPLWGR